MNDTSSEHLSPQMKIEIQEAVKEGVLDTLKTLGVDVDKPLEAQQDFAWIRRAREGSEAVRSKIIMGITGSIVTFILFLIAVGFQGNFGSGQ